MSHRHFFRKKIIAFTVSFTIATQGLYLNQAFGDEADTFISQTHQMADNVAASNLNLLLINALQNALFMKGPGSAESAIERMNTQSLLLKNQNLNLKRLHAISSDTSTSITGETLTQLYKDYMTTFSQISTQKLKLDGIRRDAYAFRANMFHIVETFLNNLENTCSNGLHINPYDGIRPSLKALFPTYEVNIVGGINGSEGPKLDLTKTSVGIGKTEEEKAMWALFYASNVVLSTYAIKGTWVLTSQGFANLALGTQTAALGMALGVTMAVAAVIVISQTIEARNKSKEYADQQLRIFEQRANHETVNRLFTNKCDEIKNQFRELRSEIKSISQDDPKAIESLEDSRKLIKNKLETFQKTLISYANVKLSILGPDFETVSPDIKQQRQNQLEKTNEHNNYVKISSQISNKDLVEMIKFIMKDLYQEGVIYSQNLEKSYQNTTKIINTIEIQKRASIIRELATRQNIFEIEMNSNFDLNAELKETKELSNIYFEMDQLVLDLAQIIFSNDSLLLAQLLKIDSSIDHLKENINNLLSQYPKNEFLKRLQSKLSSLHQSVTESSKL